MTSGFPADADHPREGGVAAAVVNLLDGLRSQSSVSRVSVIHWATEGEGGAREFAELGATVYRELGPKGYQRLLRGGATRRRIAAQLRELGVDVVHVQGAADQIDPDGFASVLTIHGILEEDARYRGHRFAAARARVIGHWQRVARGKYGRTIAIAGYVYRFLRDDGGVCDFIPNAVDRRFFDVVAQPAESRDLLFVGSVGRRKNPLSLVRAAAELARRGVDYRVRLAGPHGGSAADLAQQREIHAVIRDAGLEGRVEWLGSVNRAQLRDLLASSRCLVLPSSQETAPIAIAEAQAAGLPVVASPVGGVPEMVGHRLDGLLIDPRSPAGFAAALREILTDDELVQAMGERARDRARVYHPDRVAEQTVAVYEALRTGAGGRRS